MKRNARLITKYIIMLMCFSVNADDQFRLQRTFTQYALSKQTTESLTIRVTYTVEVDSCNRHDLAGNFETVLTGEVKKSESGNATALESFINSVFDTQKYIANFLVASSLVACHNKKDTRRVFKSKTLTLSPIDGNLSVEILIPDGFEIEILKN